MASPVVAGTAESSTNTAGTSHVLNWTGLGTVAANNLLLIVMDIGSTAATLNAHADYTELLDENLANGLKILYRWATGGETAPTFTTSASTRSAEITYRITGAENPATQAPQIGTTASGSSATPDPPASATPPSSKDYLFIAFYGAAGEEADDDTWSDTPPTNYTPSPPRQKACGIAGTNLGGLIAAAERALTTGVAQDPGTFAKDVSVAWRAQTVMVHPASTQTFTQTLTATAVTSAATRQLQANKTVTTSVVASTATLLKEITNTLTATAVSAVATMTRGLTLGRTLTATAVTNIASMTRGLSFGRTLTAAVITSVASMTRGLSFGRTLSALVSSVVTLRRYRSHGLPFLYTAANWGTVSFFLEVYLRASSGTVRARLYNDTDGLEVASSEVTTTSSSYVRLRSSALTLTDAKVYSVQFGSENADAGAFRGAKLVVV